MIVLHALWNDATLHLWGGRSHHQPSDVARSADVVADSQADPTPSALRHDDLRQLAGDVWDSLLITGASPSQLTLHLPHEGRCLAPSPTTGSSQPGPTHEADSGIGPSGEGADASAAPSPGRGEGLRTPLSVQSQHTLVPCRVDTLSFSGADAVDLLTATPLTQRHGFRQGASLRFWSRAAHLVLELLAQHRFVPAVHRGADGSYCARWRVVVDDRRASDRVRSLIVSMPPVCRSFLPPGARVQASTLVEGFLLSAGDALVRRSLNGDELAHAIQEKPEQALTLQMRWLRALVGADPTLKGPQEECEAIRGTVDRWLSKLDPWERRSCRTCLRLHAPSTCGDSPSDPTEQSWTLTLHVQSEDDPSLTLDAANLREDPAGDKAILRRPFEGALGQLRADLALAARHFPPLAPCASSDGPLRRTLTLDEAYTFLRDAAPVLEAEGFKVWLPKWWREDRPRLRMRLDLSPIASETPTDVPALCLNALVSYDWRVALGDDTLSFEELGKLADSNAPLAQLRGQWVEIQSSEVQAAFQFVQGTTTKRATLLDALRLGMTADDFEMGLPVAGIHAHGWIDRLLRATEVGDSAEHVPQPKGFRGTLRPYQRKGLQWLRFLSRYGLGACLADDMGLGKTIQLIALLLYEREGGFPGGPTLLVVPMSLVGNWQREIARFAPSLNVMIHHGLQRLSGEAFAAQARECDVVVSTYGLVHRDWKHLAEIHWHRIALDEAQNIKNPAAKQSRAVRAVPSTHRVALTGTPVENRLAELWSILDFLNPGYLGTATDFRRRFAVPIERHHDAERAARLRGLIRPFVLRRLKDSPEVAADLPEKLEMTVFCNLTPEQASLYQRVVHEMLGQIDEASGMRRRGVILAAIVKLKQICNHPEHFTLTGGTLGHRSGKCDRLVEMLDEVVAENHRALVFTQYRRMGELLCRHLQDSLGCGVLFLHGGTPRMQRDRIVQRFQSGADDAPIFVLTLKAGGYGLNLTAANHVFHFDRWWNPAVEAQATDRAHRLGQVKSVQVHRFVCLGTLEERIAALIESKKALAENVVGSSERWVTEMSTEQLREFLTLAREAVAED
ncbi:MAG: DEAD/DEAH box helicase [Phycisphaerae bacterium]